MKPLRKTLNLLFAGALLLLSPPGAWAQPEGADAVIKPLLIRYECHQAAQLQAVLEQGRWRVGDRISAVVGAGVQLPVRSDPGLELCRLRLKLALNQGSSPASERVFELPQLAALVAEKYPFAGLAEFYNSTAQLHLRADGRVDYGEPDPQGQLLDTNEWWGWKGRYGIALVSAPGASLSAASGTLRLSWPVAEPGSLAIAIGESRVVDGGEDFSTADFDAIRYSHLWRWLGGLSRLVEWILVVLAAVPGIDWGLAIVVLALLVKVSLLPISILTLRLQRKVSRYQSALAPQLAEIKANYDGEDAHNRIMAAYKGLGITPFFTLKPLFASLIQIPILVAIFNALGETPQLQGAAFLWIDNLAYPDAVGSLPMSVPLLGNTLNLLPFVMTLVTVISTLYFRNPHAPVAETRRQKRNLFIMSAVFFVLFYPFPAAMVLYWTVANALQLLQQRLVRV